MNEYPIPALAGPFDDDALDGWMAHETFDPEALTNPDDYGTEYVAAVRVDAWRITNDDEAEWAARKLSAAGAALAEKKELRDHWIDQIVTWYAGETERPRRTAEFFQGRLQDYALRERLEHGRATVKLPSAEVGTTARQPKVDVEDDMVVAVYLEAAWERLTSDFGDVVELADLVKRTPKVYLDPLRKLVRIEERENGYEVAIRLGCGHEQAWFAETLEGEAPTVGEVIGCDGCKDARPVEQVEFHPIVEQVVVGPDGQPVPGCKVDPGGIAVKEVKIRG